MAIGINGLGRIGRLVLKDFFGGLNRNFKLMHAAY